MEKETAFTVNIYPASEGGYMVDVYQGELHDLVDTWVTDIVTDPDDGGHATSEDIGLAFEMAKSLALGLAEYDK